MDHEVAREARWLDVLMWSSNLVIECESLMISPLWAALDAKPSSQLIAQSEHAHDDLMFL